MSTATPMCQRSIFDLFQVSSKSLTVQDFIASDSPEVMEHFRKEVTKRIQSGKIQYREITTKDFKNTPQAMLDVLTGKNFGKQVIKIADL